MPNTMPSVLVISGVGKSFGGLRAVDSLSIELKQGEILGLIGPNGAGKTTVLNLISRVTFCDNGSITLEGHDVGRCKPYEVSDFGLARTFQEIHLFQGMSVMDNMKAACHLSGRYSLIDAILNTPKKQKVERRISESCMQMLSFFGLEADVNKDAKSLPYGRQKLLEIAKALVTDPKVLLLDEPAAGLNDEETKQLLSLVKKAKERFDLSIIVIEHTMDFIANISDRIVVMNFGSKLCEGTWDEVRCNPDVLKCYLGED